MRRRDPIAIKEAFDEELWKAGVDDGAFAGILDTDASWYALEVGGEKIALANAVPGPGDLTTVSYYVAPAFRNQGYGTKLAEYIVGRHEKASFVIKKDNEASVKVALAALRGKFAATMGRHVVRLTKEASPTNWIKGVLSGMAKRRALGQEADAAEKRLMKLLGKLEAESRLGPPKLVGLFKKKAAQFINPFPGNLPDRKITVRELQRSIRQAIAAEEEAVHFYEAIVDATDHPLAKKVFQKIADEEQVHSGEFNHLLSKLDTDKDSLDEKGEKEVDDMAPGEKEAAEEKKKEVSMDEKTALELLKWAAGPKTYPISRFMTSPLAMGILAGPFAPIGWGVARLAREIQARALLSRALRGGDLMKTEKATVEALRSAKIKKAAGVSSKVVGKMHPLAEILTSRVFGGAQGGFRAATVAALTADPLAAALVPVEAAIGVGGTVLGRTIHTRALRGRLARGGAGLIGKEREAVELLKGQARKALIKRVALGAGAAAAVGGAAYGGKKLVEATAD
jgi:rubrerythrin/GNAT superfamily N-acetyltransferase